MIIRRSSSNSLRKLENQILWLVGTLCPGVVRNFHGFGFGDDLIGEDWFGRLKLHRS